MGVASTKVKAPSSHSRLVEESDGMEEFGAISVPSEKPPPYPKSVFYIVVTEACERFSYFGMKTILTFYLRYQLLYSEDKATVVYHTFTMLCYFTPLLGALIADLGLGRYRTILWVSLIYLIGNVVISISAAPPIVPTLSAQTGVALTGLFLIALGTGGIKPCVSAFGGDQFVLPQQERQLGQFFSIFYFSINLGALLSTIVTPLIREGTTCFGEQCYFAAFGLPALLMGVAMLVFVSGSPTYIKRPASGTILTSTASCMWMGVKGKAQSLWGAAPKLPHWLDHARATHGSHLVEDVRCFTSVLVLMLPLPFFWALFDQQGSRWTFQATRMNGTMSFLTIQPDQMQVLNPLLILVLVPLMETWGYPLFASCGLLKKPLQRVTTGGLLAATAFFAAAVVESKIQYNITAGEPPLSMLWLCPQYVLITMGEVLFSVSGLQFSFTEAPESMKSVLQACWLLTISFGNLIVVLVAEAGQMESQTKEFSLFACLMILDMIIFGIMAHFYKPYRPDLHNDSPDLGNSMLNGPRMSPGGWDRSPGSEDDPTRYSYENFNRRTGDSDEEDVYDSSELGGVTPPVTEPPSRGEEGGPSRRGYRNIDK